MTPPKGPFGGTWKDSGEPSDFTVRTTLEGPSPREATEKAIASWLHVLRPGGCIKIEYDGQTYTLHINNPFNLKDDSA